MRAQHLRVCGARAAGPRTGRGEVAALFPVVAALLASLLGRSTGSIAWWAWPVAAGDDPLAAGLALATLALGLAAALRPR